MIEVAEFGMNVAASRMNFRQITRVGVSFGAIQFLQRFFLLPLEMQRNRKRQGPQRNVPAGSLGFRRRHVSSIGLCFFHMSPDLDLSWL
jgi:hypothetical protein